MSEKLKRGEMGIREIETDSFENYRQKYPETYPPMTWRVILENFVKSIPDRVAFIQGEKKITWNEFEKRTNRVANGLLDLGLKKGDRIAINGFNSIEWMEIYWGASNIGLVPVNLNPRYLAEETRYIMEDSDSVVLFTEDRWIDIVEKIRKDLPLLRKIIVYNAPGYPKREIPSEMLGYEDFMREHSDKKPEIDWEVKNDDFSFLMYTGGTTGLPKGVVWDNWNRVGSLRWGLNSSGFETDWDSFINSLIYDEKFLKGTARLVERLKIPIVSQIGSQIIKLLGDILSKSKFMRDDLSLILKSELVRRILFQYLWQRLAGQPFTYRLIGGRMKMVIPTQMMHANAYEGYLTLLLAFGATGIFLEPAQPFDAKKCLEAIEKNKANMIMTAGDATMIPMLDELERAKKEGRPYDISSLWLYITSSVRSSAHLKKRFLEYNPECLIIDAYGTTESGIQFAMLSTDKDKDTIKEFKTKPRKYYNPLYEYLLLDLDTGKEAKPGCKRAQFAFGGAMGLGYWKTPSKTKKDFVAIKGKRYHLIRDEGYLDEEGSFHLVGRGGDFVINTGGEKVYSEEVEEILKRLPKVRECGVIGVPDERWGEAVTAIVELFPGVTATEDEMREYCRENMARYKVPKNFIFHEVPRLPTAKIDRKTVKKVASERLGK